jgi:hypothetical protein
LGFPFWSYLGVKIISLIKAIHNISSRLFNVSMYVTEMFLTITFKSFHVNVCTNQFYLEKKRNYLEHHCETLHAI